MYFIETYNEIEGFHRWAEATGEHIFLSFRHRHVFQIRCKKTLKHADREIEIIRFQREISNFIESKYGRPAEFGGMSCEEIAKIICTRFNLDQVSVLEDGISGGGYMEENDV